jgi:hypothetical protein
MEEKIYQKLKEGLKNSPLSDRTIRSKAIRLAKRYQDEEAFTDEILNDAVEDLEVLSGQYNKDVADTIKAEKEKLEAKYKKQEQTEPPAPPKEDNKTPEELEALRQDVERVKSLLEMKEKAERTSKLKTEALKLLKEKHNADNEYVLSNALLKIEIADQDTASSIAEKAIPVYDAEYKLAYGEGVQPRTSRQGGEPTNDYLKQLVDKKKKQIKKN